MIWALTDPRRLSPAARACVEAGSTGVSAATVWEMAIKRGLGKLPLPVPAAEIVALVERDLRARLLPVEAAHAVRVESLPLHHADPFDRLLIAQAQVEGLAVCTADDAFRRYDVRVIW